MGLGRTACAWEKGWRLVRNPNRTKGGARCVGRGKCGLQQKAPTSPMLGARKRRLKPEEQEEERGRQELSAWVPHWWP